MTLILEPELVQQK